MWGPWEQGINISFYYDDWALGCFSSSRFFPFLVFPQSSPLIALPLISLPPFLVPFLPFSVQFTTLIDPIDSKSADRGRLSFYRDFFLLLFPPHAAYVNTSLLHFAYIIRRDTYERGGTEETCLVFLLLTTTQPLSSWSLGGFCVFRFFFFLCHAAA